MLISIKRQRILIALVSLIASLFCVYLIAPMGSMESRLLISDDQLTLVGADSSNGFSRIRHDSRGKLILRPGTAKPVSASYSVQGEAIYKVGLKSRIFDSSCKYMGVPLEASIFKNGYLVVRTSLADNEVSLFEFGVDEADIVSVQANYSAQSCASLVADFRQYDAHLSYKKIALVLFLVLLFALSMRYLNPLFFVHFVLLFSVSMLAEELTFGVLQFSTVLVYIALSFACCSLLASCFYWLKGAFRWLGLGLNLMIFLTFYSVPLLFILYHHNFDLPMGTEALFAIFQSNTSEGAGFLSEFVSVSSILIFTTVWLFCVVSILWLGGIKAGRFDSEARSSIGVRLVAVTLSSIVLSSSIWFEGRSNTRVLNFLADTWEVYQHELDKFRRLVEKRKDGTTVYDAQMQGIKGTYIVVIGESASSEHMGIYGYLRDTTPQLSALKGSRNLTVFSNAFSSHTHTMPSLSLALTEASQHNDIEYFNAPSVIDIFKSADVETAWVSNQVMYGDWDNLVSVLASASDQLVSLNKGVGKTTSTSTYDGEVVSVVSRILDGGKKKASKVVFVHLMGSHSRYCSRYPAEFKRYSGDLKVEDFGKLVGAPSIDKRVNCYDNSIAYTDDVISKLIGLLKAKSTVSGLLYFSDHGEDVFNGLGHNSAAFTYEMTKAPVVTWLSDSYVDNFPNKVNALSSNSEKLYSNDFIYDSLLGIIGINTEHYSASKDVSSKRYELLSEVSYTLHGKKKFSDSDGYRRDSSIDYLGTANQMTRVIPHRVNTVGKVHQILRSGYNSFELDVVFRSSGFFEIGHGEQALTGQRLDDFLERLEGRKLEKLWLDVKNFKGSDSDSVLSRLRYLDEKYDLKSAIIFETSEVSSGVAIISKAGFHTSYYLPTGKIKKLLKANEEEALGILSRDILKQVEQQELSAVSFDSRLYPFVDQYLSGQLDSNVVYHTWDLASRFADKQFIPDLLAQDYYQNERVETILVPYRTPFDF